MKYNNYSEDEIIKLYHHYKSANKVISKIGIYKFKVYEILARNKDLSFTNIEENLIKEVEFLYKDNIAINNIAKQLNVSYGKIKLILAYLGIDNRKRTSKYKLNENYFEKIDNEHKAYWLGFLYADGYVTKNKLCQIEITLKDKDILNDFIKDLEYDNKISYRNINNKIYYRLIIYSKKMNNDLQKLGCFNNKSLILKFPTEDQVPKDLIHHFMRGYFDGDGNIDISKTSIQFRVVGTEDFLMFYKKILKTYTSCKTINIKQCKGNAFELSIGGRLNCIKIYNFLFKNSTICLLRKKNIFINMIEDKKEMMLFRPSLQKCSELEFSELLENPKA